MTRAIACALAALALGAGCLRLGPGEDLHLVCEAKSGSPRMAYGIEFLLAQTRVESNVSTERLPALLEAARHHVVTPRGAPHGAFDASLADDAAGGWMFHAVGVWDGEPQDDYWVRLGESDDGVVALARDGPGPVQAPRTLVDAAWAAVNGTPELASRLSDARVEWAAWDPELPSCVRLRVVGANDAVTATANIVQARIVDLE